MDKKHLLLVAALMIVSLPSRHLALAENAASQPDKPEMQGGKSTNGVSAQDPIDDDITLLRKDLRAEKKQIVAANMDLTDAEAEKFWPVYDQYAADLAKIYDTKIALFQEYLENYDSM